MSKFAYLTRSALRYAQPDAAICPCCGCRDSEPVDRKFVVTQLRRCQRCRMQFRTPTDDPNANQQFYEESYEQGFTTEMPSPDALRALIDSNFEGSEKDYRYYISVLRSLGLSDGASIFDFGCSWGYGSYQMAQAGFHVEAFEIAPTRRRYAIEKLNVAAFDTMDRVLAERAGAYDCFFSAHVLEHVPSPYEAFEFADRLLKEGGVFVAFVPNGSSSHRNADPRWRALWGEVHPNFLDDEFFDVSFSTAPRAVAASPVRDARLPDAPGLERLNDVVGGELFFAAKKNGSLWTPRRG